MNNINNDNKYICADLIPAIVSWTPIDSLQDLDKASVVFTRHIFESGLRVFYRGFWGIVLDNNTKVIRMSSRYYIIKDSVQYNDNRVYMDSTCMTHGIYVNITKINVIDSDSENDYFGEFGHAAVDIFRDRVILTMGSGGYDIINTSKISVSKNEYLNYFGVSRKRVKITTSTGVKITATMEATAKKLSGMLWYNYIDFDSCQFITTSNGKLGYDSFEVVWNNGFRESITSEPKENIDE